MSWGGVVGGEEGWKKKEKNYSRTDRVRRWDYPPGEGGGAPKGLRKEERGEWGVWISSFRAVLGTNNRADGGD